MAELINLRRARKAKARQEGQNAAEQARLIHGVSKAQKARGKAVQAQADTNLDAHKREPKP